MKGKFRIMENNSGKTMAIIALFVAVIGLSVGFAALQTTLTINGSARVKTSSWDVHFANLEGPTKVGNPTINGAGPTLTDTTFGTFDISFQTPGESVTYKFDVTNGGSYDAKISTITPINPQCAGTGETATTDASNVCDNLTYTFTYTSTGAAVSANDELPAGETKNLTLKIGYNDVEADKLPKADVTISNLGLTILYVEK